MKITSKGMNVVTRLDLGDDFDEKINLKVIRIVNAISKDQIKVSDPFKNADIEQFTQHLLTEVRRLVLASYAMGVKQGKKIEADRYE